MKQKTILINIPETQDIKKVWGFSRKMVSIPVEKTAELLLKVSIKISGKKNIL